MLDYQMLCLLQLQFKNSNEKLHCSGNKLRHMLANYNMVEPVKCGSIDKGRELLSKGSLPH